MPIDRNGGQYITANPQQPTQSSAPGIWDIDEQGSAQAAGRWPLPPNVVQRSLRFNSADSAYLSRTPATASNRKTWTWSGWVKRSTLGGTTLMFGAADGTSQQIEVGFNNDSFYFSAWLSTPVAQRITTAKYRDVSAWYHMMCVLDMTQATATDRVKLYVNGVQITDFSANNNAAQNTDFPVNNTILHAVGREEFFDNNYFNGYMAEVNFVDGQALTPTSFGQTDAQTGQWIPRVYSGSYGTNGFRLQFLDNSGTTATTLGKDTSGMGNNWTPNNFSVAAGSGNDSLRDVPMNYYSPDNGLGGEVIGNYCTLNPVDVMSAVTLTNGNLDVSGGDNIRGTVGCSTSGKWYFEYTKTNAAAGGYYGHVGLFASTCAISSLTNGTMLYRGDGNYYENDTLITTFSSYTTNDVIGVAVDVGAGNVSFYKNNVLQGTRSLVSQISSSQAIPGGRNNTGQTATYNFGQRPFAYTAPSGFKALCTQNLPWSGTITTSGTFTGNASTDGPFVYLNGIPTAMTINGNAVTFGTQADKLSNGFKVRSSSSSYNASGSNTYSVSTTGNQFSKANAQANP